MKVSYSDQQMIQRYVRKSLRDDELAQFECWLFDHPEMVVEIETQLALREGIRLGAAFDLSNHPAKSEAEQPVHKRGWFAAIAAGLIVAVLAPAFLIIQQQGASEYLYTQLQTMRLPSDVKYLKLEQTRSAIPSVDEVPTNGTIFLDGESRVVVVQIDAPPHFSQYNEFAVSLTLNDIPLDDVPLSKDPDEDQFSFSLHTDSLEEGIAIARIMGRKGKLENQLTPELHIGIEKE